MDTPLRPARNKKQIPRTLTHSLDVLRTACLKKYHRTFPRRVTCDVWNVAARSNLNSMPNQICEKPCRKWKGYSALENDANSEMRNVCCTRRKRVTECVCLSTAWLRAILTDFAVFAVMRHKRTRDPKAGDFLHFQVLTISNVQNWILNVTYEFQMFYSFLLSLLVSKLCFNVQCSILKKRWG